MATTSFTDKNIVRVRSIDHDNLFDYLSSAYEVLRKIFSYLSLEDLAVVWEAIEKWRPIVETTKNERTVIDSFVFRYNWKECGKMWSEAKFSVTFCIEEDRELEKNLQKHLKKDAEFIMVESNAGVIGTTCDLSELVQQKKLRFNEGNVANSALATHLRIPEFPDVGIKTFTWSKDVSFEDFKESFRIPGNKKIKCILILLTPKSETEACERKDEFVLHLQASQSEGFAVGGCLIDSFLNDSDAVTKYIVFYGDKVEAASTVLTEQVNTEEHVYSEVEELKSVCPKKTKGVVFVFRCCTRNKISRQAKVRKDLIQWEREALKKHFQRTPVVGCYGYGEFGNKFPNYESSKSCNKKARQCDTWEHGFSTSIVYIGFKNMEFYSRLNRREL